MTFTEFLSSKVIYAWFVIALGIIGASAFSLKYFLDKRKLEQEFGVIPVPTHPKGKIKIAKLSAKAEKKAKKGKKVLEDTKITGWHPVKSKKFFSFARWKEWYLDKYHMGTIVLIHMELKNGFFRIFTTREKEDGFIFRGNKYLFSEQNKVYNIDAKLYEFFYHEEIALPINLKIPATDIKRNIESTEGIDVEYAINPATLQRFMTAKIAEGVMRGTQLDEFMKKLQMFLIVTMITVLAHFALFLYASGILQNIKVAGIIG